MSTYSPSLRIELITTGDQAGTWGNTTNTNLGTLIESSIAGYTSVSVIAADQAFTTANGAPDEARHMTIALTTTTALPFSVYAPPVEKTYVIYNASAETATIYNSTVIGNTTAAGTGVAIPAGKTMTVWSEGTNFRVQNDHFSSVTLTTPLAVAQGGTGQTTATAAFNALAPSQTGNNGRYLKSDGTNASWDAIDISTADITGTLPIANGGTNATTAANARTNLGLVIGTDVQAFSSNLTAFAAKTAPTGDVVGTTDTQSLTNKTLGFGLVMAASAITSATAQSASGTSVDFTSIPSWVKRITVMFSGVSTNGTSLVQIQLGDSGGVETTGYNSGAVIGTTATSYTGNITTGFVTGVDLNSTASSIRYGSYILSRLDGNTWVGQGNIHDSNYTLGAQCAGAKTLSATLDRVRITTVNGTDAFDAGTINILYE
jgi:hypothetical protein